MSADHAAALAEALLHLQEAKAEAVELTAAREVLQEAITVAMDDAGERLSTLCTALLRGHGSIAEVSSQLEALRGLVELLREVTGEPDPLAKRTSVCT